MNKETFMTTFKLQHTANELLRKMARRRGATHSTSNVQVTACRAFVDGPYTFVVVATNEGHEYTGSAKFNPADFRKVKLKKRNGATAVRYQTKYSERAGELRALHRAIDKILI
jgi:hypothetical protein